MSKTPYYDNLVEGLFGDVAVGADPVKRKKVAGELNTWRTQSQKAKTTGDYPDPDDFSQETRDIQGDVITRYRSAKHFRKTRSSLIR